MRTQSTTLEVDRLRHLALNVTAPQAATQHRMIFARNACNLFTREDTRAKADHFIRWMANIDHMTNECARVVPSGVQWDNRKKKLFK